MPMFPVRLAILMLALWLCLLKSILPERLTVSSRDSTGLSSLSLPSRLFVINDWSFLFICNLLISMVYLGSLLNSWMKALPFSSSEPLLCIFSCGTVTHPSIPYMLASTVTGMSAWHSFGTMLLKSDGVSSSDVSPFHAIASSHRSMSPFLGSPGHLALRLGMDRVVFGNCSLKSFNAPPLFPAARLKVRFFRHSPLFSFRESRFRARFSESFCMVLTCAVSEMSLICRCAGSSLPSSFSGFQCWSHFTSTLRNSTLPMCRFSGLLVVSLLAKVSRMNWKLGFPSCSAWYRCAWVPKSCAFAMLMRPSKSGSTSIFAARREAWSMVLSFLSFKLMSSMMTLFRSPNLMRPMLMSQSHSSCSADAATEPIHCCTTGIYTATCRHRYSPQIMPIVHWIVRFSSLMTLILSQKYAFFFLFKYITQ